MTLGVSFSQTTANLETPDMTALLCSLASIAAISNAAACLTVITVRIVLPMKTAS